MQAQRLSVLGPHCLSPACLGLPEKSLTLGKNFTLCLPPWTMHFCYRVKAPSPVFLQSAQHKESTGGRRGWGSQAQMEGTLQRIVYKSPVSRAAYLLPLHSACNQLSGGHYPLPEERSHLGIAVSWTIEFAAGGNFTAHTYTLNFSFFCLK